MSNGTQQSRRKLLKTIAVGGGVLTTAKALPENWSRPMVESVVLPAHANGSCVAPCPKITGCTPSQGMDVANEFYDTQVANCCRQTAIPVQECLELVCTSYKQALSTLSCP